MTCRAMRPMISSSLQRCCAGFDVVTRAATPVASVPSLTQAILAAPALSPGGGSRISSCRWCCISAPRRARAPERIGRSGGLVVQDDQTAAALPRARPLVECRSPVPAAGRRAIFSSRPPASPRSLPTATQFRAAAARQNSQQHGDRYFGSSASDRTVGRSSMAAQEPGAHHHVVVALETFYSPVSRFALPAPHTYELRDYHRTTRAQAAERVRDAEVVILTTFPLTAEVLSADVSPRLRMVNVVASGTDSVDLAACAARGIVVANSPHCNAASVADHALALYFSLRRSVALTNALTRAGEWTGRGSLHQTLDGPDGKAPRTCRHEVAGIVGYGAVGKLIEAAAGSLGMKVLISGRKGAAAPEGRVSFDKLIRESSVIFVCLPRSPETLNLISDAELDVMKPYAVLVNMSRGGIVDESALVSALQRKKIAGAGTDVYTQEPAGPENNPLFAPGTGELNLVTTPHVAWCAEDTNDNYNRALEENVAGWVTTGEPKYRVI